MTLAWFLRADPLLLALALALRLPQLLQVTELSVRVAASVYRPSTTGSLPRPRREPRAPVGH